MLLWMHGIVGTIVCVSNTTGAGTNSGEDW